MKIIETFWVGRLGFVKVNNGFETQIKCGLAEGVNEQVDTQSIARNGYTVPATHLRNFLDMSSIGSKEYEQMEG